MGTFRKLRGIKSLFVLNVVFLEIPNRHFRKHPIREIKVISYDIRILLIRNVTKFIALDDTFYK